jgi:hypothetical protein
MADDFLRDVGSVFGIGVGSIEILLVKPEVRAGETLHGRVQLKLSRKMEAKRLVCGLECVEERAQTGRDGVRRVERVTLHRFEQQLDGKRTYLNEGYDLHLPVPAAQTIEMPSGVLGEVARFVTVVQSMRRSAPRWRVFALLDIPWKANVTAEVDLAVR